MPPSPAMRYSPGREARGDGHKRRHSLESGILFREKDDDLTLFNEMQSRERDSFLLQSSDDLEDSFASRLRHFSDVNVGISIPGRRETSDLLNVDGDKNDYDWLLTPPDTPLFPSLDEDPPPTSIASRGRPQSKPITISRSSTMEKSRRSSRGSASPNRLSPSPRSGSNTLQSRGRPSSSVPNYSPTSSSLRNATPSRRPSPPPNKPTTPVSKSSSFTPRRLSTGSSGSVVTSGVRGTSPVKTSRGNSSSPKIRAWQTNIPGFSSEAPPNLRTSLADRPATYVRGSSPASRNGRDSTSKFSRQSMSPTPSRSSSSIHSHDRDPFSSRSKGSIASSGDDDLDSLQSIPVVGSLDRLSSRRDGSFSTNRALSISKKSPRMASPNSAPKKSFDSAFRQMDRKSPQNMFRPLLSSVPSTTLYAGNSNSAHRSLVYRNSSIATSSNATSDRVTTFALDTEGISHSQDDMASETDKMLYPDLDDEVFAFDKMDELNANIKHEINEESVNVMQNQNRGRPTEAEGSAYHAHSDAEGNESSETSRLRDVISEIGSFENTAICSQCGCCYQVVSQTEENIELCPECSRKTTLLRAILPESMLAVSEGSSVTSANMPKEAKSLAETSQLRAASELPQETDTDNLRFPLGEHGYEESQTSCSELNQVHSQNSSIRSSLSEGGDQIPTNQLETNQPEVDYKKHNDEFEDQQLDHHSSDRPNMSTDPMEGTGISVLLKRSSSNKGPIVRARTFTATTISYDDLSLSRDSVNSIRSSTRPGSYSASSSTDFGSTRPTEFRIYRQSSGRKLDADCGYESRIKPSSTSSSISITSNHSHHEVGLATRETPGNTEYSLVEEIPQVLQDTQISENTMTDVVDASPIDSTFAEEEKLENDDSSRGNNARSSELLSQEAGFQPDDDLVTSLPNPVDCISYENVEDHPNNARNASNTETSVKAPESSCHEKNDVQSSDVNELNASVIASCSTITESEIEGENYCGNGTDLVNDDLSLASKSALDDFQEPSARNPSSDCHTASVSELNVSESRGTEESTVTVECQGTGNTRSLTLEEATDTILFCSSIIHDLAYQAATIAMENERSDPFEGSEPTVTLLGKPVSEKKDVRRRPVGKRALKTPKTRQKSVDTDVKTVSGKTENDENIDESYTNNVGLPNKVDNNSMKPPKLESKCNCIIM